MIQPPPGQLLKWIGNKHKSAAAIATVLPQTKGLYFEPFLGSGAVLGTLAPAQAVASDLLAPLIDIWQVLRTEPEVLLDMYQSRHRLFEQGDRVAEYAAMRDRFNAAPNPGDLLFLARTCYGGVIRFDKTGRFTTPCGVHRALPVAKFARVVTDWHPRVARTTFVAGDFEAQIDQADRGDVIYCDPPYRDCQRILYGAQAFDLYRLFSALGRARDRGAFVALSIDGTKRSGDRICNVAIPHGLFAREVEVSLGRSQLRRFQMAGQSLESEVVADRLLITW